jgi:hypothetical protein
MHCLPLASHYGLRKSMMEMEGAVGVLREILNSIVPKAWHSYCYRRTPLGNGKIV